MKSSRKSIGLIAIVLGLAAGAAEKNWMLPPETAQLRPGPGVELVMAQCMVCHSVDYISTQPPMSRDAWIAIVLKMKEKYGAPIQPDQIPVLASYLVKTYGTEQRKP